MSVNHITAIASYPRTSVFSYSEFKTEIINIYNYPSLSIQSTVTLSQ